MTQDTKKWRERFEEFCKHDSVEGIVEVLRLQSTSHAGTANANIKDQAIKSLKKQYKGQRNELYRLAVNLCNTEDATAQEVGAIVLADLYEDHEHEIESILHRLADSPNWEVREWAASACGSILEKCFERFYPIMASWAKDESENVRRSVALAVMYAGKSRNLEFADPLLDLIEALLPDRSNYVRDNLGPFAIGSALIKYYPDQVLERLHRWVQSDDEQVRWNVAMVFSAAHGANYATAARDVLETLDMDEHPSVQRAVSKAMKNIRKRCPEFFDE